MIFISLNAAILLILVDVIDDLYMYEDMPRKKEKFRTMGVRKNESER